MAERQPDPEASLTEILAPEWSSGEPLILFAWLVEVGDVISPQDRLAEIGIEGVSRDLESPRAGVVHRRMVTTGSSIRPGQLLLTLSAAGTGSTQRIDRDFEEPSDHVGLE
jgi:pyruvate/2-oxoglutarate dehydrogenase complex dihydrolipoamide acyltransferase (E2) component